ncbi:hypothetical protein Pelo_19844 [Pelomyxa schiedti]|nr:hypothetical protein Pelo_19844 [Pelomyxa schiedti]
MLLRQFPEITADVVRDTESFMHIVTASPLNIEFSISKLGLRIYEIVSYLKTASTTSETISKTIKKKPFSLPTDLLNSFITKICMHL